MNCKDSRKHDFSDVINFVSDKAKILNKPLFSKAPLSKYV